MNLPKSLDDVEKAPGFVNKPSRKKDWIGVAVHDTVTRDWSKSHVLRMLTHGVTQKRKSGNVFVPPPLYNWVIFLDGSVYAISHDRSNNAGRVDKRVLDAIKRQEALPKPKRDSTNGNYAMAGVALARVKSQPVTPEMEKSLYWICGEICKKLGVDPAKSCAGHRELTRRKVDPGGYSMTSFRAGFATRKVKEAVPTTKEHIKEDNFLEEVAKELLSINANPRSLKYVLEFYRTLAEKYEIDGSKYDDIADKLLSQQPS